MANKILQFSDIDKCRKQDDVFRKKIGGQKRGIGEMLNGIGNICILKNK